MSLFNFMGHGLYYCRTMLWVCVNPSLSLQLVVIVPNRFKSILSLPTWLFFPPRQPWVLCLITVKAL